MGGIVEGGTQMVSSALQAGGDYDTNVRQYTREQRAADAAIDAAQAKGAYEQTKQRILTQRTLSEQKVGYANSGVDAGSGTAANTQANTAALGEFDAQQAAINAAREVYGLKEAKTQSQEDYLTRKDNIARNGTMGTLGGFSKFTTSALSLGMGK